MVAKQLAHVAYTVTDSSTEAVAANENRTYLLLINDSDTAIYIKFGAAAVENEGIRLNANGGSLEISDRNQNLDLRAINAIAGTTGKELIITEG